MLVHMQEADRVNMTTATMVECRIVLHGKGGPALVARFDALADALPIDPIPVSKDLADTAYAAFQLWGKGIHPAALNFGDCFAYALAKQLGEPLLFKGRDFARTDIEPALTG